MKKIFFTLLVSAIAGTILGQIPQNGLIAHFNMNGLPGFSSSVHGKIINPNNYSSDTRSGGATKPGNMTDRYSLSDSAGYFAYTSYQYEMADNSNNNSLLKLSRPMSFGAWVLMVTPDFTYNKYPVLFGATGTYNMTYGFQINLDANPSVYMVLNSNTTLNYIGRSIGTDPYGSVSDFRHVMGTWDNDDTLRFYYQGKLVAKQKFQGDSLKYEAQTNGKKYFSLGGLFTSNGWNGRCFNGALDDVVLYNRALTAQEIWDLFNNTNKCSNSTAVKNGHLFRTTYKGADVLSVTDTTMWHNDQCDFEWYANNTYKFTTYGSAQAMVGLSQNGTYKVKVINKSTRCWYWTNDVAVTNLGGTNHTYQTNKIIVNCYPNPVKNELKIASSEPVQKISIYTLTGLLISEQSALSNPVLNTETWPAGTLIVKVETRSGTSVQRIVKE